MNLCWDHDPNKRPKMADVVEWCNGSVFKALRAVYHLEDGKLSAVCQCQVDRTHVHSLDANDTINTTEIKFIITPSDKIDDVFSFPVLTPRSSLTSLPATQLQSSEGDGKDSLNFEVSRKYSQIWIAQRIDKNKSVLQIFSYTSSKAGCKVSQYSVTHCHFSFCVRDRCFQL